MSNSNDIVIPGDEAYLSFGGWAKPPNPPKPHERRRYIVDTECTDVGLKSSGKGERSTRTLSILRVKEIVGAKVPDKDIDENQGELLDDEGQPVDPYDQDDPRNSEAADGE